MGIGLVGFFVGDLPQKIMLVLGSPQNLERGTESPQPGEQNPPNLGGSGPEPRPVWFVVSSLLQLL